MSNIAKIFAITAPLLFQQASQAETTTEKTATQNVSMRADNEQECRDNMNGLGLISTQPKLALAVSYKLASGAADKVDVQISCITPKSTYKTSCDVTLVTVSPQNAELELNIACTANIMTVPHRA